MDSLICLSEMSIPLFSSSDMPPFLSYCFRGFGFAGATYCICKDGVSDQALQKAIDYACGSGADCSAILQNGACYQPNTVKDHCNYAVNSYFQKKAQSGGTCDFSGTAMTSDTIPSMVLINYLLLCFTSLAASF